jgi:hypothetical protein
VELSEQTDGTTPLYIAGQEGHVEVVRALVELGAAVNQADDVRGWDAYVMCRWSPRSSVPLCGCLLLRGATIERELSPVGTGPGRMVDGTRCRCVVTGMHGCKCGARSEGDEEWF